MHETTAANTQSPWLATTGYRGQAAFVRGDLISGTALQIADGYHQVCASYHTDENTAIPCRLAPLPTSGESPAT
ncbi:MAG: hypothetical protein JO287_25335 [Pseudonocardiales bacterium]|nr:hypothetical protein [Pseudonocardiales bacterium]